VPTCIPNREWAHERDNCRGLVASTSNLPSVLKTVKLNVLTSGFEGGVSLKIGQWRSSISAPWGTNSLFEITSRCLPAASYEHTCGIVPNRPAESRYMSASLVLRSVPGQLVLTTTVPVSSDRIGSSSERMIFLGRICLSCTLWLIWACPSIRLLASS